MRNPILNWLLYGSVEDKLSPNELRAVKVKQLIEDQPLTMDGWLTLHGSNYVKFTKPLSYEAHKGVYKCTLNANSDEATVFGYGYGATTEEAFYDAVVQIANMLGLTPPPPSSQQS